MSDKSPVQVATTTTEPTMAGSSSTVHDAQAASAEDHRQTLRDAIRLSPRAVFWSVAMSSAIIMEGYDTMLMGNMYALPTFQRRYGEPTSAAGTSYEIAAAWQTGLGNGSVCGQLLGLLVAGTISERFGFRRTITAGLLVIAALIFIQFFAPSLAILLVGQILFGIPLGMFQTTPIIYAMEIAPAALRPYLTSYVNMCWAIGHLIGAGILRGCLSLDSDLAYRIPFAIQWVWPVILVPILYFAPESPWWLVRQGRTDEARSVLSKLTTSSEAADVELAVDKQVALMVVTTEYERRVDATTSYLACFRGINLRRTLIVMGIYCAQTLSGNSLRSSSTYFLTKAGLPSAQAFNMTIVGYALALLGGICCWFIIPVFGRRSIFLWSLVMMFVLMIIIGGLGVPQSAISAADGTSYAWAIGAILIVSSFLYNVAMGGLTNTQCAEIPSALLRSKSVVLARWTYSVMGIIAGTLTPYQLNVTAWNWGAKTGFFWAGSCLLCVVFAYCCVPETKDRATAEIDVLFERKVSLRRFAQTPVDLVEAVAEKDMDKQV